VTLRTAELNKDSKYNKFARKSGLKTAFLLYDFNMFNKDEKLGVFIVPTGIGASVGGYAGDAAAVAREFSKYCRLIVNPNVVNAGGFSGINDKMLYVEGFSLDEFVKGNINLKEASQPNKIGIVFDKAIPQDVLNVHINTMNAVKTVYGIDILGYEITRENIGVEFEMNDSGVSYGSVTNPKTMLYSSESLINKGCNAIALVGMFKDPEGMNEDYANGIGTDPVGGVEAILSHYVSKYLNVPCAHSPAFEDYQIYSDVVNPKSASEYITPTFLPCILLGLSQAPQLTNSGGVSNKDIDFLIVPYNSLGSPAVFAAINNGIKIFAVRENKTALDITAEKLGIEKYIYVVDTYKDCIDIIKKS